jgi:diadenosine tetraphosphate (Ap4A) HIT family hydrolase
MEDCIFCKIVKGELPSAKIWEDDKFLAILDAFPNTRGMTLVMPKEHFDSYVFAMPEKDYSEMLLVVKRVARLLEKTLGVERVTMVMEGQGVNHSHIKLYPMRGLDEESRKNWVHDKVFFEKYPGYTNTLLGPKADFEELKKLAEEIRSKI